jgi:hypothetical protein
MQRTSTTDRYINRERFFGIFFLMTFRHIFSGEFWSTAILCSGQWRLAAILKAASQTSNLNILVNPKPNSKIFYDMNQGHRWVRFMKKTRGQNSRATVPLMERPVFTAISEGVTDVNRYCGYCPFLKILMPSWCSPRSRYLIPGLAPGIRHVHHSVVPFFNRFRKTFNTF